MIRARRLGRSRISARQVRVLPEPLSPTSPRTSPSRKLEGDLVDRAQRAAGCGELDGQILDPKDRPAHSRTPSFSPSPSARKLKPSARNTIASPGKVVIHQAVVMKFWPSAIITPHSAVGGWTPRPR